ncbi:GNAT family N-acetyltransferase [Cohnella luojiensis]|uniref:GNAT family N-acetyltransferase n=1 Tax=Cohnella luojiensis TaxID=652876 RepID=A0A4Y8LSB3_9BACL|nr:GNAT family N-acetyltransferase [Cohnella luojiensis]TFE23749.1 GNAT family N-acetyltransferase [Cohnella luojiensis]
MLHKFDANDRVLSRSMFTADEVPYNLIHRVCDLESSTKLKTTDDTMIYAQSEGHNAWLWISREVENDRKNMLLQELIAQLNGAALPGISGEPKTVETFAKLYGEARGIHYHHHMAMEAYYCPKAKKPINMEGALQRSTLYDVETVAEFMAGFSEWAYGISVDPASQIPAAEGMIATGNLYLWLVDGLVVSMANIAHRAPRHARINAVYTPPASRKKGYASAIVAELCSILESERLVPMLYADLQNPDSNKVYRNIGFVESGKIADIKFK